MSRTVGALPTPRAVGSRAVVSVTLRRCYPDAVLDILRIEAVHFDSLAADVVLAVTRIPDRGKVSPPLQARCHGQPVAMQLERRGSFLHCVDAALDVAHDEQVAARDIPCHIEMTDNHHLRMLCRNLRLWERRIDFHVLEVPIERYPSLSVGLLVLQSMGNVALLVDEGYRHPPSADLFDVRLR